MHFCYGKPFLGWLVLADIELFKNKIYLSIV